MQSLSYKLNDGKIQLLEQETRLKSSLIRKITEKKDKDGSKSRSLLSVLYNYIMGYYSDVKVIRNYYTYQEQSS